MGKYKLAAKNFLQASVDHCDFPEVSNLFRNNSRAIKTGAA